MICSSEFISFGYVIITKLEILSASIDTPGGVVTIFPAIWRAGGRKHRHTRQRCRPRHGRVRAGRGGGPCGPWAGAQAAAGVRWRNHTGACVQALRRACAGRSDGRGPPPRARGIKNARHMPRWKIMDGICAAIAASAAASVLSAARARYPESSG